MSYAGGILAGQRITAAALNNAFMHTTDFVPILATSAAFTTTEVVWLTSDSVTFTNGRAYEIMLVGRVISSVTADTVDLRVRKTNLAGIVLLESFRLPCTTANVSGPLGDRPNLVTNTTGADITAVLVATASRGSGTGRCNVVASAVTPAYLWITDIGLAADYPGATAVT